MPNPFARLLARLSVGRKLLLIYLLDLTAVIFISGILVNEKFIAIDFARKELAGNAYIGAVREALLAVAEPSLDVDARARRAAQMPALQAAERRHGEGMRSEDAARAFAAAVQGLGAVPPASEPAAALRALEGGRELLTRVGNQSNLILDPDLDSYYTMSLVVLRFPELLEVATSTATRLHATGGVRDNEERTRYFILEGRLDAVAKGIEADHAEAAAANAALGNQLWPERERLAAAIEAFRRSTRAFVDEGSSPQALAAVEATQRQLLAELDGAWRDAQTALDGLLADRIHGFFMRMWLHLGTALVLLALILSAVYFVARQIAQPLRRLAAVMQRVRETGDYALRAQWNSHDEIGRLVVGFNGMLAQLDHHRDVQQELAANASAAAAQRSLVEAMPIPLMVTAVPGHEVLHANQPAQQWLDGGPNDPWRRGLPSAVRGRFFQQLADRGAVDEFEVPWQGPGGPNWAVLSARRLQYQGRDAVLTAFAPINHLKALERRLELWAKVFEASSEGIMIIDGQRRILSVNRAFRRSVLHELHEVVGEPPDVLLAEGSHPTFGELWPTVDGRGSWQGEVTIRRLNGGTYPALLMLSAVREASGSVSHYIATTIDITERKRNEARIQFLAHHDVLTGLPNRSLCSERLRMAVQQARRSGHKVGVLFIDLDRFKNINDSLGHHVGDTLLRSVAQRLQEAVREGDTVSRLGGDEFVVVLAGVGSVEEIVNVIEHRLLPRIRAPHQIDGAEIHASCSLGVAICPDDGDDIDALMRHADAAMYQAKAAGRDAAEFFTPELNARAQSRLKRESALRHAITRGELALHYQPRIDAASEALVGVEALLRWQHPELGAVAPVEFIPIAEECGLIGPIGAWVADEACRQQAAWHREGRGRIPVSINLSAVQLRDEGLVETLRATLERHQIPPGALELELTETALMQDVDRCMQRLQDLRALGVLIAIDDFGTGYSSLEYLSRFPIDRLKIDRSFVHDLTRAATGPAITRAIIALGRTLELKVVAEGVETEDQAHALRASRCDELQGYHFARPMAPAAFVAWLEARDGATLLSLA